MLTGLRIAGLGVIAEAGLEPGPGMTVVTGETGAGKTMIVTGLGLLLGGRVETTLIRMGSARLVVEGRFARVEAVREALDDLGAELDADGPDGSPELLASRQVQASGRSRALLGGVQVPLATLGEVMGELAAIHGQSEQVRLGTPERQREVLDRAGGPALAERLRRYRAAFAERRAVQAEVDALVASARERAREQAMLRFGLDEIGAVGPRPGEDAALAAEAHRLQAVDDLRLSAQRANHALSGASDGDPDDPGASGLVGQARKAVEGLADRDAAASGLVEAARAAVAQVNDFAAAVAGYLADLEADPVRLEAIAARRAELQGLTRKYGENVDAVIAWADAARARLDALAGGEDRLADLTRRREALSAELSELAAAITADRTAAAARLAGAVDAELAALAMPQARLRFELTPLNALGPHGAESVQIVFAAHPDSPVAPLARVASGGELSRVRLALEVVLAQDDPGHTFVFDEVDAGVGGAVGLEIGRRLARLAKASQVIVVTHLAQVAAFADRHYVVAKSSDGAVTTADVAEVAGEARVAEIARMMGGLSDSEAGLGHARDLLAAAGGG